MKKTQLFKYRVLSIGLLMIIIYSCNYKGKKENGEKQISPVNQAICPKNFSYSECPNSPALHGQIMVHNMTNKSYEVEVEHHENIFETKRIAPDNGWTFVGIIQGSRLLKAKPSTGDDDPFESNCIVIGNTQHMMNIMSYGFVMIESREQSGHAQEEEDSSEIIHIPIRKEIGH